MANRIVAFGCSHTNGAGMIDTWIDNDYIEAPSKYSYVNTLAKSANMDLINKGINGASNRQISNEILNFTFKDDDIVYVMWTYIERSCIIKEDRTIRIGAWIDNKINNIFYKNIYEYHNLLLESQHYIQLAKLHLEKTGVKFVFCCCSRINFIKNNWFDAQFLDLYFEDYKIDTAEDNYHWGIDSNKKFGTDLYNFTLRDKTKC